MKKPGQNYKGVQLKLDFSSNNFSKAPYSTGKIINMNHYSRRAFASYIVKNSKSF